MKNYTVVQKGICKTCGDTFIKTYPNQIYCSIPCEDWKDDPQKAISIYKYKNKRKGFPLKLRFQVLMRDGFRCVYCGATAKDARLHIDHINPYSKGGLTVIENLVTACEFCNIGKGALKLNEKIT